MTLAETGTRALLGAVFGPPATGETDYARRPLGLLEPDVLVLTDRGVNTGELLTELAGTGAHFLAGRARPERNRGLHDRGLCGHANPTCIFTRIASRSARGVTILTLTTNAGNSNVDALSHCSA